MEHAILTAIESKLLARQRIDRAEAAWLFREADDAALRRLAGLVRARFHRSDEATYLIMAVINYTNVCVAKCDYCAFYVLPGDERAYLLSDTELARRVDRLVSRGGRLVSFNGGFHPRLRIADYAALFRRMGDRYPGLSFFEMTVAELMYSCKVSNVSYAEGARTLKEAGTRWITGGGAEVLDEAFRRRHSPGKLSVEDYYRAQRAVLEAGIGSTATMVIGFDETLDERLNHLESLRRFQDEVEGALPSFLCWTYKASHTALGGEEISSQEYLRWLAVCRVFLDNFVHIRTSVLTKNAEALLGLFYGANDFDLPTEDEVTQLAGATISDDFEGLLDTVARHGIRAVRRDPFPVRLVPGRWYTPDQRATPSTLRPARLRVIPSRSTS